MKATKEVNYGHNKARQPLIKKFNDRTWKRIRDRYIENIIIAESALEVAKILLPYP